MISALAPGRPALTEMVGKSTWGKGETGSTLNAMPPAMAIATVSRVVATGRRMNGLERLMRWCYRGVCLARTLRSLEDFPGRANASTPSVASRGERLRVRAGTAFFSGEALRQVVEEDVDDRRGVQRQHLAQQQPTDHRDSQRPPQLRAYARAEGQRNPTQQAAIVVIMIGRKRSRHAS